MFSSSIAEVLTAFLLQEDYEDKLQNDPLTRWALIKDIIGLVDRYSRLETGLLLRLHEADPTKPLFVLSEVTSEQVFALQDLLEGRLAEILAAPELIWKIMEHYIPAVLRERLGQAAIMTILNAEKLQSYRNAMITKKMASMAFYRFGEGWDAYLLELEEALLPALQKVFGLVK